MRAIRLHGPDDVRLERVPVPEPGPGQVRITVEAALTGGTVRKLVRRGYHATLGTPPLTLGHEACGVVSAIGEGVDVWQVGDRVVPANSAPGPDGKPTSWSVGAFADEWIVPAPIVEKNLHRIPDQVPFRTACLTESLATVLKGMDRTPPLRGSEAVVLGLGALGLLWVRVLSRAGAVVTAVSRSVERADAAAAMGASRIRSVSEQDAAIDRGDARAELVVEAVGTTEAWALAMRCVKPQGRVNFFGGPPRGSTVPFDTQQVHYEELTLIGSFHHTPRHFSQALRWLSRSEIDVDQLIAPEAIGLNAVPLVLTSDNPTAAPKTLVQPGSE